MVVAQVANLQQPLSIRSSIGRRWKGNPFKRRSPRATQSMKIPTERRWRENPSSQGAHGLPSSFDVHGNLKRTYFDLQTSRSKGKGKQTTTSQIWWMPHQAPVEIFNIIIKNLPRSIH